MSSLTSEFAIFVTTGSATLVLLYSALLLNRLRSQGGLPRILARTLVSPESRTALLRGVSIVTGMFMLMGAVNVAVNLGLLDAVGDIASATIFCIGAATLLFQIRTGMNLAKLSMEDELDLRDAHPGIFEALAEQETVDVSRPSPLYLALPLEQSRVSFVAPFDTSRPIRP